MSTFTHFEELHEVFEKYTDRYYNIVGKYYNIFEIVHPNVFCDFSINHSVTNILNALHSQCDQNFAHEKPPKFK